MQEKKPADRSRRRNLPSRAAGKEPAGCAVDNGLEFCFVFSGSAEAAFPNGKDSPSRIQQFLSVDLIAFTVALKFVLPPLPAGSRQFGKSAFVIVPETAIDKDNSFISWKHEVWLAGKVTNMQAVAKTHGEQGLSDEKFGAGVLSSDAGHIK